MKDKLIMCCLLAVLLISGCTTQETKRPHEFLSYDEVEDLCSSYNPEPKELYVHFVTISEFDVNVEHRTSYEFHNDSSRMDFYDCRYSPGCWIGKFSNVKVEYVKDGFNWETAYFEIPRCNQVINLDFVEVTAYWEEKWECITPECTKRVRVKNLIGSHGEETPVVLCQHDYITVTGFESKWDNCTIVMGGIL